MINVKQILNDRLFKTNDLVNIIEPSCAYVKDTPKPGDCRDGFVVGRFPKKNKTYKIIGWTYDIYTTDVVAEIRSRNGERYYINPTYLNHKKKKSVSAIQPGHQVLQCCTISAVHKL